MTVKRVDLSVGGHTAITDADIDHLCEVEDALVEVGHQLAKAKQVVTTFQERAERLWSELAELQRKEDES